MEQNNSDEIDLGIVFSKLKKLTNNFLISIYRGIQFLFKHWWIILIIAIIGYAVGYFSERNDERSKETTIIVQNNFQSSNYVYEAVNQLNQKVKEKDTAFLKNAGFRTDTIVLSKVEIIPIVNIIELLNKSRDTYRPLETYLEQTSLEDKILTSELFLSEYKYHRIHINTSSKGTQNDVDNVISYLNSNEVYNNIKNIVVKETKDRINHYKETIRKIDNILESQSSKNLEEKNSSQLLVSNGADYTDFFELINSKNNSIAQIISLETELTKFNNVVTVINKPALVNVKEFFANKKMMFAVLFVFLYLFFFLLRRMYFSLKEISEKADNN